MAVLLYDATIEGSQLITAGTTIMISADFLEVNAQSFSVASASATLYNSEGVAVSSNVTDMTATISAGIRTSKRVSVTINSSDSTAIAKGQYYLIWELTLGDNQTRKVKQSIEVRSVS